MIRKNEILVTTTNTLEGWEIKQYLKPISAHVVAGTNIFSDFFASFSDVFGGRSATYQKQLTSIYNEAIERLRILAFELGANAVLSMKVDLDEISGKSKSMFMITATGTAVIAENKIKKENIAISNEKTEDVSINRINNLRKRKQLIEKANSNSLELDETTWDFIIDNKVSELGEFILENLKEIRLSSYHSEENKFQTTYNRTIEYLLTLTDEERVKLLYERLMTEDSERFLYHVNNLIKEMMLLNFELIKEYLLKDDFTNQKRALQLVSFDKPFYNKEDIEEIKELLEIIGNIFKERGQKTTQKKLLTSKEKDVWICECGKQQSIENVNCSSCGNDIFGFKVNLITPNEAKKILKEKAELITENLK
ncbi:hypothetical protein ES705_18110 [subsurface metagenome]